jgi:hypothetical protein
VACALRQGLETLDALDTVRLMAVGFGFIPMTSIPTSSDLNLNATKTAETNLPPSPPDKEKTCYWYAQESLKWLTFGVEILGLVGLFYYACITVRMWREMQRQTSVQRDTYVGSQRSWA